MGKDVSGEEKSEQAGNEVVSVTAVPIVENTHANVLIIDDEEEVEQAIIVQKSEEEKACGKSELKSEKAPKKKSRVDSGRFDRAIQMFDRDYGNDEEDEFGVGK